MNPNGTPRFHLPGTKPVLTPREAIKRYTVTRMRLDAGGYANRGRDYYGRGERLWLVTDTQGVRDCTMCGNTGEIRADYGPHGRSRECSACYGVGHRGECDRDQVVRAQNARAARALAIKEDRWT